jgi:hypothetical protein
MARSLLRDQHRGCFEISIEEKSMKLPKSSIVTLIAAAMCACTRGAEPEPAMQPASGIDRGDRGRAARPGLQESVLAEPEIVSPSAGSAQTPQAAPRPEQSPPPVPTASPLGPDPSSAGLTLIPAFISGIRVETLTVGDGVATITSARCAREARCGKVGAHRAHADSSACQRELARDTLDEFDPDCRVDPLAVRLCADKLRTLECGMTVDTLGRLNQCRASSLCLAH